MPEPEPSPRDEAIRRQRELCEWLYDEMVAGDADAAEKHDVEMQKLLAMIDEVGDGNL